METQEILKTIKGFEDYEVSNLGRVKSLKLGNVKILKQGKNTNGYPTVCLTMIGKQYSFTVHKLISMSFLNHVPCGHKFVINHKNHIKTDNNLSNIEIITNRENTNKKHIKSKSKYVGVCFNKSVNKLVSSIVINRKRKYLGCFDFEIDAHLAYQN